MDQVLSMPGFRFHPTDVELINYFLKRKVSGRLPRVEAITEIDLYKYEPWDLPGKSCLQSRDLQWYFFSRRGKKYPNGHKKERSTKAGHWKTTGKDKEIYSVSQQSGMRRQVGMKKTLVYHIGRAPRGNRTNWVMHEYRLEDKFLDMSAAIQTKADEIFEGLEDIDFLSSRRKAIESTMQDDNSSFHVKGGMDIGVLGSASFDQFLPDTHESSRESLHGCFFELNDLANPVQLDSFLQETPGNWDAPNGSDDFGIPSMETLNKNTGPICFSPNQYRSTEVAKRTPTSQYGNCMLLEGDNSEIELLTRPQAEYSGTPFWTEGQLTNPTSSAACTDCLDVLI